MRRTILALALVSGLVAACGSSAATGAPTAATTQAAATAAGATSAAATPATTAGAPVTLDACKLITTDEAAAVLGEPVDPGTVPTPGATSCLFSSHPATGVDMNSIEISLIRVSEFTPDKKSIPGLTFTPVSGIGDGAYFVSMGAGHTVLNVRKGQVAFTTSVLLAKASDATIEAGEKTLALEILGRI
jgi:hypothetical protein